MQMSVLQQEQHALTVKSAQLFLLVLNVLQELLSLLRQSPELQVTMIFVFVSDVDKSFVFHPTHLLFTCTDKCNNGATGAATVDCPATATSYCPVLATGRTCIAGIGELLCFLQTLSVLHPIRELAVLHGVLQMCV